MGLALLAAGLLIGLYGLFAVLYNGDCRGDCGDVYVTWFGRKMEANLIGGIALVTALVVIALAAWCLRSTRRAARR